jgi:hypothetical protein
MSQQVTIDTIRSLAYTGISASYAKVGSPCTLPIRIIRFINNTDGDMFFSDDGVNNKLFLPTKTFLLFDLTTAFIEGTQFYVKQSSAPSTGSVYIEFIYGGE